MHDRGVRAFALCCVVALAACVGDPAVYCPDGKVCPSGTTCQPVAGVTHCATPEQLAACAGQPVGTACEFSVGVAGVCNGGVCVRPGCNDGILGADEKCDGAELGGETCVSRGYNRGDLGCTAECSFDVSQCVGECGDGVISDEEDCDPGKPDLGVPPDLGGATCAIGGFYEPAGLACNTACRFVFTACGGGRCGDEVVDGARGEECDGAALGSASTCRDLAYYGDEPVQCTAACRYDRVACEDQGFCGDGTVNGDEQCEAGQLGTANCQSVGGFYDAAGLRCNNACLYDVTQCTGRCGDGVKNGTEECDTTDLGTTTRCDQIGFYGTATLGCTASCTYDRAACEPGGFCGDGTINGSEQCDGAALAGANCQSAGGYYAPAGLACNDDCRFDFGACQGRCGDGVINGLEVCDPGVPLDPAHDRCGDFGFYNTTTAVSCSGICQYDVSACVGRCGDGAINGPEQCDGTATGGATCSTIAPGGWHGNPALSCDSGCRFDTRVCTTAGRCGDGQKNGPEQCDASDFGGQSCATLFPSAPRYGSLVCTPACAVNTILCSGYCGDSIINGPEACDAGPTPAPSDDIFPGGATCQGLGYQSGDLICLNQCAQIANACIDQCGDGVLQGAEECDGAAHTMIDGACSQLGEQGALGCSSFCRRETTACEATTWRAQTIATGPFLMDSIYGLWTAARRDVWALMGPDSGNTRVVRGDGVTWADVPMAPEPASALSGNAAGTVWVGDADGTVAIYDGSGWASVPGTLPLAVKALAGDATRLFAATDTEVYRHVATQWVREPVTGVTTTIQRVQRLRFAADGRLIVLFRRIDGQWVVGERSSTGTWTTDVVSAPGGFKFYDVLIPNALQVLVVGGADDTLPFANNDAVMVERRGGAWTIETLSEPTPTGPRPIRGAATGVSGELDDLWISGFDDQQRGWTAAVPGGIPLVTRTTGPFGRFVGLTDSGHGDLWAWGAARVVAHREGGGWRRLTPPAGVFPGPLDVARLSSVAVTATDVWIAGNLPGGGVARYREGLPLDQRWEHVIQGFPAQLIAARTSTDVWAFTFDGQAQRWNGTTWTAAPTPFAGGSPSAVLVVGGVLFLADSASSTVWRTSGGAWSAVASWPNGMYAENLAGTGATDLWVSGSDVYHYGGGPAFDPMPFATTVGRVTAMWAVGPNDVWAAGENNGEYSILHRSFITFGPPDRFVPLEQPPFLAAPITRMWGSGPDDVWAIGQTGQILHYDGQRWTPVDPAAGPTITELTAIHGAHRERMTIVGHGGVILTTRAALPPTAAPPCADAMPLYCSSQAPQTDRVAYGTIAPGGRARYRFDPPYRAAITLMVRTPTLAPQPQLTARVVRADPTTGRCALGDVITTGTSAGTQLQLPVPFTPEVIVPRHAPIFIELTTDGTAPVGYEFEFLCAPPNF